MQNILENKKIRHSIDVTTIIPFFNSGKLLAKLLDSVLSGSCVPSEILLIDDESTDESTNIAKQYSDNYSCVKYYKQKHGGVSAARNFGIRMATKPWVSFLDADDYIEPDMYELIMKAIADESFDGCLCGYFTNDGEAVSAHIYNKQEEIYSSDMLREMFTNDDVRGYLFNRLFKTEHIKALSFDNTIGYCEDLLFQSEFFSMADRKFACVAKPLYHYVSNSSSATATKRLIRDNQFVYKNAYDKISEIVHEDYVQQSYNDLLQVSMYRLLSSYKKGNKTEELLMQIRQLQKELKRTPCKNISKRRIAFQYFPILYSYFM
ncbi:glycosyltransferase family 2 protein [Butyrivibrio sp. XBB1001]|uniref:glycosyltransferase family 2 protein n=1 Tax=Butyrivibrio sp. XBB1001 TaxID=1280682 RepID=UPI0004163F86|nr:glycosyltransferase family 2 protein [Butyrivibrio sp. XBB1001]